MDFSSIRSVAPTSSFASTKWALYSWPPIFWQTEAFKKPRLAHLTTCITRVSTHHKLCSGQTVWGCLSQSGDVGLAWDWEEISRGVVAMVDPMRVISNMQLVNAQGEILTSTSAALHFNRFVVSLPWQREVVRLLQT